MTTAKPAPTTSYTLRGIPRPLWSTVKIRAITQGETVRAAMLRLLKEYGAGQR